MLSVSPIYAVAQIVSFNKKKNAIYITKIFLGGRLNYVGHHFRARGYFVSTVDPDEALVRNYIKSQKAEDRRLDKLTLF